MPETPITFARGHVNGVTLHHAHAGDPGRPLMLFLRGFPEFWYAWHAQLREFGRDHFAVAPDTRGVNLSDKPGTLPDYRAQAIVTDLVELVQEPVGLGASKAKMGPSEDSFCRICSPIAQLWGKKTVKNGPLRHICSRRFPGPTGSWGFDTQRHKRLPWDPPCCRRGRKPRTGRPGHSPNGGSHERGTRSHHPDRLDRRQGIDDRQA